MSKVRIADYLASFVSDHLGVDTVYLVSGGGMMFLSDGLALNKKLKVVCNHHEQASAMAAVGYAKLKQDFGCAYLTTGCGGTNAVTGLLNAYQDNTPCFFISGQVKRKETSRLAETSLRQFGVQETDIISIVEPISKYAVMITEPERVAYHLEKAAYIAKSGRPGPVWIDIPMDIQGAMIEEADLIHFDPVEDEAVVPMISVDDFHRVEESLVRAQRPIIIAGQGIRLGKAIPEFKAFVERYNIPFAVSRLGIDLLPSDHPLFIGRIGTKGDRAGNFAVQNADFILVLGSRLSVSSTGHQYETFGREAKVVVLDVDACEHRKNTVEIDHFIHGDVNDFLRRFPESDYRASEAWSNKCLFWKSKWPVCLPEYADDSEGINLYWFTDRLASLAPADAVVVSDAGSAFYVVSQGFMFSEKQRYVTSGGQAEMGYTLPASIGTACARPESVTLAVTGDGSLQMNIQELQTLVHYQLPVKLFVWNNNGYLSIRASQRKFFDGRFIGTDKASGVSFPDLKKISDAYGIQYLRAEKNDELDGVIKAALALKEPSIIEIMCIADQEIVPSAASTRKDDGTMVSKPLEDMYPFLSREEFFKEMIIPPLSE
ncbi:MAG: thiamine pyrophosphate-binding protein [Lentisphaerae bacterium]|nr:thiamine pyrophosphate-binding protein [Lentisphaerota bacterium]